MEAGAAKEQLIVEDEQLLAKKQDDLAGHQAEWDKAVEWRRKFVKAIRESYMLEKPLLPGSIGVLTTIDVKASTDRR